MNTVKTQTFYKSYIKNIKDLDHVVNEWINDQNKIYRRDSLQTFKVKNIESYGADNHHYRVITYILEDNDKNIVSEFGILVLNMFTLIRDTYPSTDDKIKDEAYYKLYRIKEDIDYMCDKYDKAYNLYNELINCIENIKEHGINNVMLYDNNINISKMDYKLRRIPVDECKIIVDIMYDIIDTIVKFRFK